jgi:hypothetical protein
MQNRLQFCSKSRVDLCAVSPVFDLPSILPSTCTSGHCHALAKPPLRFVRGNPKLWLPWERRLRYCWQISSGNANEARPHLDVIPITTSWGETCRLDRAVYQVTTMVHRPQLQKCSQEISSHAAEICISIEKLVSNAASSCSVSTKLRRRPAMWSTGLVPV